MAKQVQIRRGTTAEHATFVGAVGEITVDTDKDVVVVHDGSTAGGYPLSKAASPSFTGNIDILGPARSNIVAVSASAIDCSQGNFFTKTASGALTWTFTNVPSSRAFTVILELTNGGTGTQTWPAAVKWPGGTAPTLTASGVDVLGFITDDGGTNWRGVAMMVDSK